MFYDDFLILDNEQYDMLNEQYKKNLSSTNPEQIFVSLCETETACSVCASQYNSKLQHALLTTQNTLQKLENNMQVLFNFTRQKSEVKNKDIFSILLDLTSILEGYNALENSENKAFNLQLKKDNKDLLFVIKELLLAMKNSNLHFFKFM